MNKSGFLQKFSIGDVVTVSFDSRRCIVIVLDQNVDGEGELYKYRENVKNTDTSFRGIGIDANDKIFEGYYGIGNNYIRWATEDEKAELFAKLSNNNKNFLGKAKFGDTFNTEQGNKVVLLEEEINGVCEIAVRRKIGTSIIRVCGVDGQIVDCGGDRVLPNS